MADNDDNNKARQGFSGLSSMVSDVEEEITKATQAAEHAGTQSPFTTALVGSEREQNEHPTPYQQPSTKGMSPGAKWMIALVVGLIVIAWLGASGSKQDAPVPGIGDQPAPVATSTEPIASTPTPPSATTEEKPPVGSNLVLTPNQIRYCVSEDIRMNSAKDHVNGYNNADVNRFNADVADYNSRCSSFRYRNGDIDRIRSEVEANRVNLILEGRARFTPAISPEPPQQQLNETSASQLQAPLTDANGAGDNAANSSVPVTTTLTQDDRSSIDSVCSSDKYLKGQAAYKRCIQIQVNMLVGAPNPDVSGLSVDDLSSIQSVCSSDKFTRGPAAYRRCVQNQVNTVANAPPAPNLSSLSVEETSSLQSVCSADKFTRGPAAYRRCLGRQVAALQNAPHNDMSALNVAEKQKIDMTCSTDKFTRGPAAYNICVAKQLAALGY